MLVRNRFPIEICIDDNDTEFIIEANTLCEVLDEDPEDYVVQAVDKNLPQVHFSIFIDDSIIEE